MPDEPRPVALYQSQNINQIIGREKGARETTRDMPRDMPRDLTRDPSRTQIFNQQPVVQNGLGPRGGKSYLFVKI